LHCDPLSPFSDSIRVATHRFLGGERGFLSLVHGGLPSHSRG
jgi:hypothetical protein